MKSKATNQLYNDVQKNAAVALSAAQKKAKETLAVAKVKFKEAEKVVAKKIQTHPEQAVLIAAALGAVVGALVTYGAMKNSAKRN
ncbi:MAG: hypothetical protein Q7K43_06000 [Candidatus Woesearchaeota archaeon]|nr:hypothetical protein [Candidatus Woesearchaeota archaeon]